MYILVTISKSTTPLLAVACSLAEILAQPVTLPADKTNEKQHYYIVMVTHSVHNFYDMYIVAAELVLICQTFNVNNCTTLYLCSWLFLNRFFFGVLLFSC